MLRAHVGVCSLDEGRLGVDTSQREPLQGVSVTDPISKPKVHGLVGSEPDSVRSSSGVSLGMIVRQH